MGLNIESMYGGTPQVSQGSTGAGGGAGLIGGILGGITGGISMIGQKKRNERAFKQQKELMEIQMQNQRGLDKYGKDLALQQWKDTNYSAQVAEAEKAGLNPGLLYGMSGGGGTTANAGSGGSASGGNAPSQAPMPMDMTSMMQMVMMQTQKALMEAQTEKTKAETKNVETNTINTGVQTEITKESAKSIVDKAFYEAVRSSHESSKAGSEAGLASENYEKNVEIKKNEAITSALEIGLKQLGIEKTKAEIQNMAEQIKIGKFNANINAQQMGVDKVTGTQLNNLINAIYEKTGVNQAKTKELK